jgi:F-type H+-transporting ATPase subunit beta
MEGKLVSLEDTLDGCERILEDEFADLSEDAFYMIGGIGELKRGEGEADEPARRGGADRGESGESGS